MDDAAREEFNPYRWRDETVRLHYYRLIHRTGVSFYEDFGGESLLPDYIGRRVGVPIEYGGGISGEELTDRYGNSYYVLSPGLGIGIGPTYIDVEGYGVGHYILKTKLSVPGESEMKNSLTGAGFGLGGAAGVGYEQNGPFASDPIGYTPFFEFSIGLEVGIGVSFGIGWQNAPKDEAKAWHWLDRISTGRRQGNFFTVLPVSEEDYYPGNDCDCASP